MEVANFFPHILLGGMIVLTLVLLPFLNEEPPRRRDDEPRTDESHSGKKYK
jgi:hypothetical protein